MKRLLLGNTEIVGINPTAIIDKDGSIVKDYATTIKENDPMDRLDEMLKDGPAWDHLDAMLGE